MANCVIRLIELLDILYRTILPSYWSTYTKSRTVNGSMWVRTVGITGIKSRLTFVTFSVISSLRRLPRTPAAAVLVVSAPRARVRTSPGSTPPHHHHPPTSTSLNVRKLCRNEILQANRISYYKECVVFLMKKIYFHIIALITNLIL